MGKNNIVTLGAWVLLIGLTPSLYSTDSTNSCRPFHLITFLYNEQNSDRAQEYLECLDKNLANPRIASVHILYDTSKDTETNLLLNSLRSRKVKITLTSNRPSFFYCFSLANSLYPNQRIIFCNGDIYFDETLAALDNEELYGRFLALTRWEPEDVLAGIPNFKIGWAHYDSWIFQTPIPLSDELLEIFPGTWHCDGKLVYAACANGLYTLNPCLTIRSIHHHKIDVRTYEKPPLGKAKIINLPWSTLATESFLQNSSLVLLDDTHQQVHASKLLARLRQHRQTETVNLTDTPIIKNNPKIRRFFSQLHRAPPSAALHVISPRIKEHLSKNFIILINTQKALKLPTRDLIKFLLSLDQTATCLHYARVNTDLAPQIRELYAHYRSSAITMVKKKSKPT